jgi:hypothetical protein
MRRLADPGRCPGCGTPLSTGSLVCAVCALDLGGPLGKELFTTLAHADSLIDRMRRQSAMSQVPGPLPVPGPQPATAVRGSSVPRILLGLGAVCLLVAALVFLAVTWSVMGVGGRTATLVGLTLTTGGLTAWAARRGLRGAVESLGLVTLGLAVLDLYGADNAGWFGNPSEAVMSTIVGAALVAGGLAATSALARTAARGFTCGELAVVAGAAMVSIGLSTQPWGSAAAQLLLALCLLMGFTAGVWRSVRAGSNVHRVAGWGLLGVVALDWAALVLIGLDDTGTEPTMTSVWGRLEGWPLVAAGAVALLVAVPRTLPIALRVVAAGAGLVPLGLVLVAPATDESTTVGTLAVVAVAVGLVALMAFAPSPWGATGLAGGALCALVLGYQVAYLGYAALENYAATAAMAWSGSPGGRVVESAFLDDTPPWLLPVCVAALVGLLWAAGRLLEAGRELRPAIVLHAVAVLLGVSVVATLLLYPVPVWTVVVTALALSCAATWPALTRDSTVAAVVGAVGLLETVVLSWYDEQLTLTALLVALVLAGAVHLRTRREPLAAGSAVAAAVVLAGLVWTLGVVADLGGPWTALAGLVVLATVALGRPYLPIGLRTPLVTALLEATAAGVAVPLCLAGLADAAAADRPTWSAVYLTVAGAVVTVLALLRPDRRWVAWLGGALLVAATWVRLGDLGVDEPEPYTLPTAVALLVVGLVRLRRDRSASTLGSLGAGLGLALVPSLLWVLIEPTGLRALLLGLACLGLVVAGVQLRWTAPLVYGAAVGVLVVLREAAPYIGDSVPRWAVIGAAGTALILMGVTWEQRLRDARVVSAYVRGLR